MRRIALLLAASLAATTLITAPVAAAPPGAPSVASCVQRDRFTWTATQYFFPGDCYQTPGAAAVMEFDGRFVLYFSDGNGCQSPTYGAFGAVAVFQGDGNFVIYHNGQAIWASNTAPNPNSRLILRGNGTLIIRNEAGAQIWEAC